MLGKVGGVTLLELLLVLALVAMVTVSSVPSFNSWIVRTRQNNLARALQNTTWIARTEAIKNNQRTIVCPSKNLKTCSGQTDWENGWIVFIDVNDERSLEAEYVVPIHVEAGTFPGITASGNQNVRYYFSYVGTGMLQQFSGALQPGTIKVCAPGQNAIDTVLAHSGRSKVNKTKKPC